MDLLVDVAAPAEDRDITVELHCEHCRRTAIFPMPLAAATLVDKAREFSRAHGNCE